jgi:hypothetical protein
MKHASNLFQLEALIFGCAGFLNKQHEDKHPQQLQNEFEFLKVKYRLSELDTVIWKFLRLRPSNFPTVRLWQFAMLIHKCPELFSSPEQFTTIEKLQAAVSFPHEGYWRKKYKFGDPDIKNLNGIGKTSLENILINTIAPFLFFYGKQSGKDVLIEAAITCFDKVPLEDNHKTRHFTRAGLKLKSSGESQGLIHLFDNYCKTRSCLKCSIASALLTNR